MRLDRTIVAVPLSPAIGFRDLVALACSIVRGTERRRGVVGELLLRIVRSFHFQLVEQDRRAYDGREGNAGAVADQRIAPGGSQIAAQRAGIKFIEDGATDHLFVSVAGPDPVKHARRKAWTERIYEISIGQTAIAAFVEHLFLEFLARARLGCADEQVS